MFSSTAPIPSLSGVQMLTLELALERTRLRDHDGIAEYGREIGENYIRSHPEWTALGGTADESGSLSVYSLEYPDREGSFYFVVNGLLRDPDPSTRAKLKPYVFVLKLQSRAVELLPAFVGVVWRGVSKDLRAVYREHMQVSRMR